VEHQPWYHSKGGLQLQHCKLLSALGKL
jgi:hypothetical protein